METFEHEEGFVLRLSIDCSVYWETQDKVEDPKEVYDKFGEFIVGKRLHGLEHLWEEIDELFGKWLKENYGLETME